MTKQELNILETELSASRHILDAIGKLPGLVIPYGWLYAAELRDKDGRMNPLRLFILAAIVSQHSDQDTSDLDNIRLTWLPEEMRRCSYGELAKRFGCSKKRAATVCEFLRDRGLITIECRIEDFVEEVNGARAHPVRSSMTFMAPVRGLVAKITATCPAIREDTVDSLEE